MQKSSDKNILSLCGVLFVKTNDFYNFFVLRSLQKFHFVECSYHLILSIQCCRYRSKSAFSIQNLSLWNLQKIITVLKNLALNNSLRFFCFLVIFSHFKLLEHCRPDQQTLACDVGRGWMAAHCFSRRQLAQQGPCRVIC